jgi:osmotically inducible protein OsmC
VLTIERGRAAKPRPSERSGEVGRAIPITSRKEDPSEEPTMAKSLYTARAHVVGGRDQGHGVTSDGALDVQLRTPEEMGGHGGGTNPEQLFAVGYAACFEGALGVVGRRERVDLGEVSIDSEVSLITTEHRGFNVAVGLDVRLPGVDDPERAVSIVAAAHEVCPYSNATRGNVGVTLTANGHPVPVHEPGDN